MKKIFLSIVYMLTAFIVSADVTLDYCLKKSEENYPLIKRYDLISQTNEILLSDINKSWLPRISVYGQATAQNAVPNFPSALENVMAQHGQDFKGLGNVQYKIGVDVNQMIWDGGTAKAQREIQWATTAEQEAQIAVGMYGVRERVMNLYFGILLIDEQILQTENMIKQLEANRTLMESLYRNGTAMQSDVDIIDAEILTMRQQVLNAKSATKGYRDVLSLFIGEDLGAQKLEKPVADIPQSNESARPELKLYEAQSKLNLARDAAIESTLMPKIGFFAQAYYGYPGFDYFKSMIDRDMTINALAGIKISWNIDSFYTKKNTHNKLTLAEWGIETDRDVFLFNSRLQTTAQREEIEGLRTVMADDGKIVDLRTRVRQAAESQLRNGVIDATTLLSKITDENAAKLTASYHEIQLIQKIYNLRNTLNR